jgi:hypothetical protein
MARDQCGTQPELATGNWQLGTGNWKLENWDRELGTGNWELETGN